MKPALRQNSVCILLTLCVFVLFGACGPRQVATKQITQTEAYGYIVLKPAYYTETMKWPVLFFLHGAGERGSDKDLLKVHGPPMMFEQGYEFPAIIVAPQCPADERWDVNRLNATYDEVMKTFQYNKNQVYLTGLSMGAKGTWDWAIDQPERFAAIVPICGMKQMSGIEKISDLAIWVFHGAKDPVIPLSESDEMVAKLKDLNADVQYTVYPDEEHLSWIPAYEDEALWQWMWRQKRH